MVQRTAAVKRTGRVLASLVAIILWLTGVIVALAVGFGLILDTLIIPFLPDAVTQTAGWIVVVLTILGVLLALIDHLTQ